MTGDPTTAPRELAQRWAWWHEQKPWLGSPALEKIANETAAATKRPRLAPAERERLFAWVRERMAAEVERRERLRCWPDDVEPGCQWDGLADNDREALAHAVMTDLGLDDLHGEHGPAWTLCEAAGWPS